MGLSTVFKQRIPLSAEDKQVLGEKAVFVFDTNVLLSLYRFAPKTRAEVFPLLKRIKGRVWIPHHVGIEFFCNRQQYLNEDAGRHELSGKRIEEAFQKLLNEVSKAELDKLGSNLDIDGLRSQIIDIRETFITELKNVAAKYTAMKDNDEVLNLLDELFGDSIGTAYESQPILDAVYSEGEERYKRKQPPGFKDGDKLDGEFWQDGLIYKRKFGDLLIWKQLLAAATKDPAKFSHVVFVTHDQKDDWWDKDGHHIVGPRPELREEASRSGIASFHMCTLECLLKQLQKRDATSKLSDESIKDVKASVAIELAGRTRVPAFVTYYLENHPSDRAAVAEVAEDASGGIPIEILLDRYATRVDPWLIRVIYEDRHDRPVGPERWASALNQVRATLSSSS